MDFIDENMTVFELAKALGIQLIESETEPTWDRRLSSNPTRHAWITKDLTIGYRSPENAYAKKLKFDEYLLHEIAHLLVGVDGIEDDDEMLTGVFAVEYALTFALTNGDELRQEILAVEDSSVNDVRWARGVLRAHETGLISELGYFTGRE